MKKGIVVDLNSLDKVEIKPVKVTDIYGTEVELQFSRSGLYRFDFKNEETWPTNDDGLGNKIPHCFSFGRDDAERLRDQLSKMLEI